MPPTEVAAAEIVVHDLESAEQKPTTQYTGLKNSGFDFDLHIHA